MRNEDEEVDTDLLMKSITGPLTESGLDPSTASC